MKKVQMTGSAVIKIETNMGRRVAEQRRKESKKDTKSKEK